MKRLLSILLCATMLLSLTACGSGDIMLDNNTERMAPEDAKIELSTLLNNVSVSKVTDPVLDIYMEEEGDKLALADIDTFDITVAGNGSINIEIAAATELSSEAPDDWINTVAKNFNREGFEVNGKSVSVSVRKITSGEVVTYVAAGAYEPNVFIPSNDAWGFYAGS